MKEKTFKDLGLDEGDKYLKKIASEFDLGELDNLLSGKENQTELSCRTSCSPDMPALQ